MGKFTKDYIKDMEKNKRNTMLSYFDEDEKEREERGVIYSFIREVRDFSDYAIIRNFKDIVFEIETAPYIQTEIPCNPSDIASNKKLMSKLRNVVKLARERSNNLTFAKIMIYRIVEEAEQFEAMNKGAKEFKDHASLRSKEVIKKFAELKEYKNFAKGKKKNSDREIIEYIAKSNDFPIYNKDFSEGNILQLKKISFSDIHYMVNKLSYTFTQTNGIIYLERSIKDSNNNISKIERYLRNKNINIDDDIIIYNNKNPKGSQKIEN